MPSLLLEQSDKAELIDTLQSTCSKIVNKKAKLAKRKAAQEEAVQMAKRLKELERAAKGLDETQAVFDDDEQV